jgi:hypothetical protein
MAVTTLCCGGAHSGAAALLLRGEREHEQGEVSEQGQQQRVVVALRPCQPDMWGQHWCTASTQ